MGKEKAVLAPTESTPEIAARLDELFTLANELNEVEEQLRFAHLSKQQPDSRVEAKRDELVSKIRGGFDLLRSSFSQPEFVGPALRVFDKLITTLPFGDQVTVAVLTEQAETICDGLKNYPEYFALGLQLLSEAHNLQFISETNTRKNKAGARGVRNAITRILPDFEVYFSEANPVSEEDLEKRTRMLHDLVSIVSAGRNVDWMPNVVIDHLTRMLSRGDYVPGNLSRYLEGDMSLRAFLRAEKRRESAGTSEETTKISRNNVDILLGAIHNKQLLARVVSGVVENLGLLPEDYVEFNQGSGSKQQERSLRAPLSRILDLIDDAVMLERRQPGSARALRDDCGIRWFNRYSPNRLFKIFEESNDTSKPFVLYMSAVADSNDAFFQESDREVVESIAQQCEALGFVFRLIECNGRKEMRMRFKELRAKYKERHKISGLIIRSHSWRWHIGLGDADDDGDIHIQDLDDPGFVDDINYFEEAAPIVIGGCSAGRGIAKKFSERFETTVSASKALMSALVGVKILKQGNRLIFKPAYQIFGGKVAKGDTGPHVFNRGRRV